MTKGNNATQSLSDAFATANHEFGMADRLIGGYQVTDQVPSSAQSEEEETTKEVKSTNRPTEEVDHTSIIELVEVQSTNSRPYQLSWLSHMQPVATLAKNGQANGYISGHHQNGTSNGDARKNGHMLSGDDQNRLISPPQLEMSILHQVRSNKGKSRKRRRKAHRGPSLFDWLQTQERK